MRAIDADAFKNYIRGAYEEMKHLFNDNGAVAKLITESFCKDIDEQPTIQPVNNSEMPNSSDAISRQAAIEAVQNRHMMLSKEKVLLINDLEKLPSAEPKRGRWVGKYPVTSVCSECGYLINDSKVKVFAFCPNCGAKMEVNHESN